MATYLFLHVLDITPAEAEVKFNTEHLNEQIVGPYITLAEYSYGWAMMGKEAIPSCIGALKQFLWSKENKPLFFILNPLLSDKIIIETHKSRSAGEGQRIISTDNLRLFLGKHMGKTMCLIES